MFNFSVKQDAEEKLDEGIRDLMNEMHTMDVSSDEYKKAVENLKILYELKIKAMETAKKESPLCRWLTLGLTFGFKAVEVGINSKFKHDELKLEQQKLLDHNTLCYDVLKFEETGTVTSTIGKREIGRQV